MPDHLRACLIVTVAALWAVLSLTAHGAKPPCISVRVTNCFARTIHFATGPATLCADVRLVPDDAHRLMTVAWDYAERLFPAIEAPADDDALAPAVEPEPHDGSIGSEERSLDGGRAPRLTQVRLNNLEGGTYAVLASVYADARGQRLCGRSRAEVTIR